MMKIAFDAKRMFNNQTGLGNYGRTLLGNLQSQYPEHEYVLFTPKAKDGVGETFRRPPFQVVEAKWLPSSLWRSFWMSKYVDRERCGLFHGLSNEIPLGLSDIPKIVTIHDLIFKSFPQTYPRIDRMVYEKKSRYAAEHSNVVVAISKNTKQDIVEHYKVPEQKVRVIYQSCQPIFYTPAQANPSLLEKFRLPQDFLLSVGALHVRKNIMGILKAMHQLPQGQRMPLVIVGEGKKYQENLWTYSKKMKLDKWVLFLNGNIHLEELRQLYLRAMALVYPSLYEGFGLPVVESLLSGRPVITSRTSSLPEAAGPGGLLVNPQDTEELADAIQRLTGDSRLRTQLAQAGHAYAWQRFHPSTTTSSMMKLYAELRY